MSDYTCHVNSNHSSDCYKTDCYDKSVSAKKIQRKPNSNDAIKQFNW